MKTLKGLTVLVRCLKSHEILLTGLSFELFISVLLLIALAFVEFRASWFIPLALPGLIVVWELFFFLWKFEILVRCVFVIYHIKCLDDFISFVTTRETVTYAGKSTSFLFFFNSSDDKGIRIALEKVTIILTNLFSGQIYNISDSFASIFILTTVFLGAAVGLVSSSWRVLNVDSIQFLHQVMKRSNKEDFSLIFSVRKWKMLKFLRMLHSKKFQKSLILFQEADWGEIRQQRSEKNIFKMKLSFSVNKSLTEEMRICRNFVGKDFQTKSMFSSPKKSRFLDTNAFTTTTFYGLVTNHLSANPIILQIEKSATTRTLPLWARTLIYALIHAERCKRFEGVFEFLVEGKIISRHNSRNMNHKALFFLVILAIPCSSYHKPMK